MRANIDSGISDIRTSYDGDFCKRSGRSVHEGDGDGLLDEMYLLVLDTYRVEVGRGVGG
jgi:hypothetical protein